jgi:hypothetical protein
MPRAQGQTLSENLFTPTHPNLLSPSNPDRKIWRYMSLGRYTTLLRQRQLFFASVASLDDRWEGSHGLWYAAGIELISFFKKVCWAGMSMKDFSARWNAWVRGWTYINCWHMNTSDSEAMWKLYASDEGSVAVQSTYSRLRKALPTDIGIGRVIYHDFYATPPQPTPFTGYPSEFVFKRRSLAHERELRAIIQAVPLTHDGVVDLWKDAQAQGVGIDVDLGVLIESVHVQPDVPQWLADTVRDLTKRYGITAPVKQSRDEALF